MTATALQDRIDADDLPGAIATATDKVRQSPTDRAVRFRLAELFCINGDLERADAQLAILLNQAPEFQRRVSVVRHLIRAETARQDWYRAGRPPELLREATQSVRLHLEAGVKWREGDAKAAADLYAQAEVARIPATGQGFDDFRDLDDSIGGLLELLTMDGRYLWVDQGDVAGLDFVPGKHLLDLIWREVRVTMNDGTAGTLYMPAIYAGIAPDSAGFKLGRATDWIDDCDGLVRGKGQRCFLVGDRAVPVMELTGLRFQSREAA
ncbi:type VI secretion system accessory protein TagJ [Niveispirillum irakense]|uniref:type VI secretion system accessory protein TagJ n=1 Tax=Niveispirillum irakense TaxID=34011 RepID=UPI00040FCB03|nr:type VI secretion system accessory protein TagJ [Niveispirillum irakense]